MVAQTCGLRTLRTQIEQPFRARNSAAWQAFVAYAHRPERLRRKLPLAVHLLQATRTSRCVPDEVSLLLKREQEIIQACRYEGRERSNSGGLAIRQNLPMPLLSTAPVLRPEKRNSTPRAPPANLCRLD
jgi:hypothetical protein